jgi:hypothetical protein
MKIEEAKSILHGYRPNGADANDPLFRDALELTRNDPELREWFAKQQAFDGAMSADFDGLQVPEELCGNILAAAQPATLEKSQHQWWQSKRVSAFAIAASIALIFLLAVTLRPKAQQPAAESSLADFVISDAQHPKTHGGHGEEAAALNHLLNQPTTKLGGSLPMDFAALRDSGCRTLHVEGRDILEVCFRRNGVGLHYYVARRQDFPSLTAPSAPAVAEKDGASVVTWTDTANLYLVITAPGSSTVNKLL